MSESRPLLAWQNVTRRFPGVLALDDVSIDILPGEVHALVGENGAGKSTLINLAAGVLHPDEGTLEVDGTRSESLSPQQARQLGIVTVHQEGELFATLSIAENMALTAGLPTRGPLWRVDWPEVYRQADAAVASWNMKVDMRQPASRLSVGERQMIHVAQAVSQGARVLILDEPTSALSASEARWLFEQIDTLRERGSAIVYISHRQEEIFSLADRITVLRDGRKIWTRAAQDTDPRQLVQAMVGREPLARADRSAPEALEDSPVRLSVEGLSDSQGKVRQVDLEVRAGEVLGVYGLIGAGRSEFAQLLFGLRKRASGRLSLDGEYIDLVSPAAAVRAGIAYLPEDRLRDAVCSDLSLTSNITISSLDALGPGPWVSRSLQRREALHTADQLKARYRDIDQPMSQLSGGNQQKLIVGRWLRTEPRLLVLDEPTRGIDVGAKAEMHELIRQQADAGTAVIMISSELPEVMAYSDRIAVFCQGRIAAQFDPATTSVDEVAEAALPGRKAEDGQQEERSAASAVTSSWSRWLGRYPTEMCLAAVIILMTLALRLTDPEFSILVLLHSATTWAILGLAAAVVIIAGGIDISIGSLLALAALAAGMVLQLDLPVLVSIPLAVLAACLVGVLGGVLNATLSIWGGVHPIVVTLGTMTVFRGLVISFLGGRPIANLPDAFGKLALDPDTGFHTSLVYTVLVLSVAWIVLAHSRLGRRLYAVGSSPGAARQVGIGQGSSWLWAFALGGVLVGLAAVLQLAQSRNMQATLGNGWELSAIAVAVIGGVSITGGRGSTLGVVLGAVLLRLFNTVLVRWGVRSEQMDLMVGGLILAAVLLDRGWQIFDQKREARQ